jgi:hypothetical protein
VQLPVSAVLYACSTISTIKMSPVAATAARHTTACRKKC